MTYLKSCFCCFYGLYGISRVSNKKKDKKHTQYTPTRAAVFGSCQTLFFPIYDFFCGVLGVLVRSGALLLGSAV